MRLEGQSKAGYYPTPLEVAQLIGSCLTLGGSTAHLLDPCCGPGTALETVNVRMKGHYRGVTHGVELESERAAEAAYQLDNVLVGDSLKARARGRFSLLYLNPPYDQADGKRLELIDKRAHEDSELATALRMVFFGTLQGGWQFDTHVVADTVNMVVKEEAERYFALAMRLEVENRRLTQELSECYTMLEQAQANEE